MGARFATFIVRARSTVPPEMSLRGTSPRQAQHCLELGTRLMAVPTSELIVSTVADARPVTATRSTPTIRATCARALKPGWLRARDVSLAGSSAGSGALGLPRDSSC